MMTAFDRTSNTNILCWCRNDDDCMKYIFYVLGRDSATPKMAPTAKYNSPSFVTKEVKEFLHVLPNIAIASLCNPSLAHATTLPLDRS